MKPVFIDSDYGPLFAIFHEPVAAVLQSAWLHVPAFAEEMNKSRRMVALQAEAFAARGEAVLILDLYGTGDSGGDFADATWSIWLQNLETAIDWLLGQGVKTVDLWGLRIGTLLAMDFAARGSRSIKRLLCWQPVTNGDTFVSQFLRLRIAAAIMGDNAPRVKTSDLKQQLLDGQTLEVAGYGLHPELILPLLTLRAERLLLQLASVVIIEIVANAETPLGPANSQLMTALQQQNIDAMLQKALGEAFWSSQEISEAPALIAVSCECVKPCLE
jgi:exosortase A-associated hydrolase 2